MYTVLGHVCPVIKWCCTAMYTVLGQVCPVIKWCCTAMYTVLGQVCPVIKWCCIASVCSFGSCVSSDQMMLLSKCMLFWVMCVQWSQTEAKAVPVLCITIRWSHAAVCMYCLFCLQVTCVTWPSLDFSLALFLVTDVAWCSAKGVHDVVLGYITRMACVHCSVLCDVVQKVWCFFVLGCVMWY